MKTKAVFLNCVLSFALIANCSFAGLSLSKEKVDEGDEEPIYNWYHQASDDLDFIQKKECQVSKKNLLVDVPTEVIIYKIFQYVPLKELINTFSYVSKAFNEYIKKSYDNSERHEAVSIRMKNNFKNLKSLHDFAKKYQYDLKGVIIFVKINMDELKNNLSGTISKGAEEIYLKNIKDLGELIFLVEGETITFDALLNYSLMEASSEKIKKLELRKFGIKTIENLLFEGIEKFFLDDNKIKSIENICKCSDFNYIFYANNDSFYCIKKLINLKILSLNNNKVKNLDGIQHLVNLRKLSLKNNNIKDIILIGSCNELVFLDLSNNNIKNIDAIYLLQKLKSLNLSNNKIKLIKKNIINLTSLENLDVTNNQIEKLEFVSYGSCGLNPITLRSLRLTGNLIDQTTLAVLEKTKKEFDEINLNCGEHRVLEIEL